MSLGFFIPWSLTFLILKNLGAWQAFIDSVFIFNLLYVQPALSLGFLFLAGILYLWPLLLLSLWTAFSAPAPSGMTYLAGFSLLTVVPLSLLSGRAYPHYYLPWGLPLAMFASLAWQSHSAIFRRGANLGLAIAILFTLFSTGARIAGWQADPTVLPQAHKIVQDLRAKTILSVPVLMWGNETAYLFTAGLKPAGRFPYLTPLLTPSYGEKIVSEYLLLVEIQRPLILDTSSTDSFIPSPGQIPEHLRYLQPLALYLRENYKPVARVGPYGWLIWQHK